MEEDLAKKVLRTAVPQHLIEASSEELKENAKKAMEAPNKAEIDLNDPKMQEEYTFNFNWKDNRGKSWTGAFSNKILSIKEQQAVGVLRASLSGGVDFKALDPYTAEINLMIAHMTFSLTDKPDWAKELRDLNDVSLLQELYGEVASHEATFFGDRND